ncbi:MAG: hypothetical protein JNK16_11080 [Phycisphaerales bacterium]|nr:hypothetical protein [Phycisphaerales bacterium]
MSFLDTCRPNDYIAAQKWLVKELGLRSVRQNDFALHNRDGDRALEFSKLYLRSTGNLKGWARWQFADLVIESLGDLFEADESIGELHSQLVDEVLADEVVREQLASMMKNVASMPAQYRNEPEFNFWRYVENHFAG